MLAAHGDGDDSASNELARDLGRKAAALGGFDEVVVTFQKGSPPFYKALEHLNPLDARENLVSRPHHPPSVGTRRLLRRDHPSGAQIDPTIIRSSGRSLLALGPPENTILRPPHASSGLKGPKVTVVPLMASAGYYCDVVLPRELQKNARWGDFEVEITEPVGTHPQIYRLAQKHLQDHLKRLGLQPTEASLMVVGHGTRRHAQSRRSTESLATELGERLPLAQVVHAFLDEDPGPEEALTSLRKLPVLVLPFLMGAGTHATRDLPRRLLRDDVHILSPLGSLPGMDEIVLLRAGAQIALETRPESQLTTEETSVESHDGAGLQDPFCRNLPGNQGFRFAF